MTKTLCAVALLVLLAGCAGMSRSMTYGNRMADAKYVADGKAFSVWVHPRDNSILIEGSWGSAAGIGALQGLTFNTVHTSNFDLWRAGMEAFLAPVGCTGANLRPLDQDIAWEADYSCPDGVDLRALVAAQRSALRDGQPLHR